MREVQGPSQLAPTGIFRTLEWELLRSEVLSLQAHSSTPHDVFSTALYVVSATVRPTHEEGAARSSEGMPTGMAQAGCS